MCISGFKYFVEPEVTYSESASSKYQSSPALTYIVQSLIGGEHQAFDPACAEILVAPAGQGKTTLCRAIAHKIRSSYPDTIPVLVESNQWQRLIELTLPNVLNAALLQMIPGATRLTDPKVFQTLMRERILVPIFDGFDELSLHPSADFTATTLLTELLTLVGGAEAKVLITVRETFWEKHVAGFSDITLNQTRRLNLQGFSNQQRQNFFRKRLQRADDRDIANRLSREIGSRLYEGVVERPEMQADRESGIPLMLELIALYVDENPEATFAPSTHDPLGPLLEAVCERENVRQQLDIPAQDQMLIFENVFRDYQGDVPREDLAVYVKEFAKQVTPDKIDRFESHAFFATNAQNMMVPRFETLRVYFLARWLADQLEGAVSEEIDPAATRLLAQNAMGSSDVFDYLVNRFAKGSREKAFETISHACRMISKRSSWKGASSALFHLSQRMAHHFEKGKRERAAIVVKLMAGTLSEVSVVERVAVQGQVSGLDLSGTTFTHCEFMNLEFHNCSFDEGTVFHSGRFIGSLTFTNCSNAKFVRLEDCKLSEAADVAWEERRGKGRKNVISQEKAKGALRDILKKFEQRFGFGSIKNADRDSGPISKNPCKDRAWAALGGAGVIESHRISGVSEGGLNIVDNPEVRHEVRNFLDNAVMGKRLQGALRDILS